MHDHHGAERGATVIAAIIVVVLILAAALVALNVAASVRTKRVRASWESTLGTRDDVFARNPTTEANAAALELERIAVRLGIDLAPRSADGRPKAGDADRERLDAIKGELGEYGARELERAGLPVEPPPPAVAAYLDQHADVLADVRRRLLDGGVPSWETEFSRLSEAPIPNLLGNITLAKLLTADAFAQIAAGKPRVADENLTAVWQLARSLRDTPILINQLISVAEARFVAGALRHLEPVDEAWVGRLAEHDYLESMIGALQHDGWVLSQYAAQRGGLGVGEPRWPATIVIEPLNRYRLAGAADAFRQRLAEFGRIEALCDGADVAFDEPDRESAGFWGVAGGWILDDHAYVPNLTSTIHRVARLEMEIELTRKLLVLHRSRHDDGAWPGAEPWLTRSEVCPDDRWIYEVAPDGSMRLGFGRGELPWPGMKGVRIPNHVTR